MWSLVNLFPIWWQLLWQQRRNDWWTRGEEGSKITCIWGCYNFFMIFFHMTSQISCLRCHVSMSKKHCYTVYHIKKISCGHSYPEWPQMQGGYLVCGRLRDRLPPRLDRFALCKLRSGVLPCKWWFKCQLIISTVSDAIVCSCMVVVDCNHRSCSLGNFSSITATNW